MMYRLKLLSLVFFALLAFGCLGASSIADDSACVECHDSSDTVLSFAHETGQIGCVDCHGASSEHINRPATPASVPFSKHKGNSGDQGMEILAVGSGAVQCQTTDGS